MTTAIPPDHLLGASQAELTRLLAAGHVLDPRSLHDREYRGVALGVPGWVETLTWKTFKKVFHWDPERRRLRGWNVAVMQDGVAAPCRPRVRRGRPITYGHYEVRELKGYHCPKAVGGGVMLDYGRGGNPWWDVMRTIRDPLVALAPGDPSLLLGWSYAELGVARLWTPFFFCLADDGPLTHVVTPPGLAP